MLKLITILAVVAVCYGQSQNMKVTYTLFKKHNQFNGQSMSESIPGIFNSTQKTIFLIHGYAGNTVARFNQLVRDSIFDNRNSNNFNVIVVDWTPEASFSYAQASNNVHGVARNLASFIERLTTKDDSRIFLKDSLTTSEPTAKPESIITSKPSTTPESVITAKPTTTPESVITAKPTTTPESVITAKPITTPESVTGLPIIPPQVSQEGISGRIKTESSDESNETTKSDKPIIASPSTTPESVITGRPTTTPESVITAKPTTTPESVITAKPTTTAKPIGTGLPIIPTQVSQKGIPGRIITESSDESNETTKPDKPIIASPSTTPESVITGRPTTTPESVITAKPTTTPESVITAEPTTTAKPIVTGQPIIPELVSQEGISGRIKSELFDESNVADFHLVGFGLGAHVAGIAGRILRANSKVVGRITGLDPSRLLWGAVSERLSRVDAKYVEVIHTNNLGTFANGIGDLIGDINFYANGGSNQPGCFSHSCNHDRAFELFAASMINPHLLGQACTSETQMNLNLCRGPSLNIGGVELSKIGLPIYRINTSRKFPFY